MLIAGVGAGSSAEVPEEGKESLEHSSSESEVRQNRSVEKLSCRLGYRVGFQSEQKPNGQSTHRLRELQRGQLWQPNWAAGWATFSFLSRAVAPGCPLSVSELVRLQLLSGTL